MAVSQQSIIENAYRTVISGGTDPNASPSADVLFTFEDNFRDALKMAVIEQGFQRSYTLTLANGKVILPDIILEKLNTSTIYSDDPTELSSFEETYLDYLNFSYGDNLSRFYVGDNQLHYTPPGGDVDTFDGDVHWTLVSLPDLSDVITDPLLIPGTLADRVATILTNLVRGVKQ